MVAVTRQPTDASEPSIHGAPLNASGSQSRWSNWARPYGRSGLANQPARDDCRADSTFSAKRPAVPTTSVNTDPLRRDAPISRGSLDTADTDETVAPWAVSPCQTVTTPTPVRNRRTPRPPTVPSPA